MSSIEEKRSALLQAKLKEMADYGVSSQTEETYNDFEPMVESVNETPAPGCDRREIEPYDFIAYAECYLAPRPSRSKSGFTINSELLQLLRQVLTDIQVELPLTAYIENILWEHLKTHQQVLNTRADSCRRYKTLDL